MFIVLLNYKKPLEQVDRYVPEHRAYLKQHYASGQFLLSGRKEPRTGGVILMTATSRAEVETLVRADPFHREELADYEIIEFHPAMAAVELAHLKSS